MESLKKLILPISDGKGGLAPSALLHILSVMAYPRNQGLRAAMVGTLATKIVREEESFLRSLYPDDPETIDSLLGSTLFRFLRPHGGLQNLQNMLNLEKTRDQFESQLRSGLLVGRTLNRVIQLNALGLLGSVNRAIYLVKFETELLPKSAGWPGKRSERFLRDIWQEYKPAAHLWAALGIAISFGGSVENPDFDFLTQNLDLDRLLSIAESIRESGCNIYPHGRNEPILDSGETWRLPSDLQVAPAKADINALEDWAEKALKKYRAKRI